MAFTECKVIDQRLQAESGRIGPDTYRRGRGQSIWLSGLVTQKPWLSNMGTTIKNTVYERSGLTAAPTWEAVNPSDGASSNACIPPVTTISSGMTNQEYARYHIALESEPLCLQDIVDSHEPRKALQSFVDNLMDNANFVRTERRRSEYQRLAKHKVIVAAGLPEDDTDFPATQPTSQMTLGVLRRSYRRLERESANLAPVATSGRGAQQYLFVASGETIENIVKNNADVRDDIRWSSRADMLTGAFDQKFSYAGFIMQYDPFPPRYNWNGSGFTRVPEYVSSSATVGSKLEINSFYEGAQFEASFIFHPDAYVARVPDPQIDYGNGIKYAANNYALEFRFVNEHDRQCNPDRTIGYFRALGMDASEPVHTQLAYSFLSLRCDADLDLAACGAGSGYA